MLKMLWSFRNEGKLLKGKNLFKQKMHNFDACCARFPNENILFVIIVDAVTDLSSLKFELFLYQTLTVGP